MKIKDSIYKIVLMLLGIGLVIFFVGYICESLFYKDFSYNDFSLTSGGAFSIFYFGVILSFYLSEEVNNICQYFGEKRRKKITK